jgi:Uma2 family endonuclease
MALSEKFDSEYYTYANYKHWSDKEQWEIIKGEAYNMSPAPGMTHQRILVEISRQIAKYLEDKHCELFAAPFDVFLPEPHEKEEETSTIVQPDISIVCDKSMLSEKGCTGCPDIIIEIISPRGASRDQITKRHLFEKKGIKEYWIVHPVDKILWKYVLTAAKEGRQYGKPQIFDNKDTPSFEKFPDFKLDLLEGSTIQYSFTPTVS